MHTPLQMQQARRADGIRGLITEVWYMTEKNEKKQKAKKSRNFWTCARPVTQIVPNKKAYNRKRNKDDINKGRCEE